jgi:DNA-binding SARP family transcriptional activator
MEVKPLLLHFLYREDIPIGMRDNLHLLLEPNQADIDKTRPSLQVFAFGPLSLSVAGKHRQFTQRGGLPKTPEFLLYLLLEGQDGGCRWNDVSTALWPELDTDRASRSFHQILKRLRDVIFASPDYILRRDDYYQVNNNYLEWCDALVFEQLYERASRAAPAHALALQLELIALYRGPFLAGFELSEWGETYRAACETRFFQAVKLAGEQLLKAGSSQEALAVVNKGLDLDYFREDLHQLVLSAYAQLGLYNHLAAHYVQLSATFEEEFGAPPEPETQQLYERMLATR